jgi:large subunit ribosomal protein L23
MSVFKKTTKQENNPTEEKVFGRISNDKNIFIIKHPWITEKSYNLSMLGKYTFLVDKNANKNEIKKAIKNLYKVDPINVNIVNIKGKTTRLGVKKSKGSKYKKAIVTLKTGQKIDIMPT